MKEVFKKFRPIILPLLVMIAFVGGQAYVNLTLPEYTAKIVNQGILYKNIDKIWENGRIMLVYTLVGMVCSIIAGFLAAKVSAGYVRKLREAVFMKVERFSLNEFDKFSTSSLITRTTNDMQQIQSVAAMVMRLAFMAPFMCVGSIVNAYRIAPSMSWIIYLAIGIIVTIFVVLFVIAVPKFNKIQELVDKLSLQLKEMLTGVRVVRAYNNDKKHQYKFDKTNKESTRLNIFINRLIMMMMPVMTMIMGLTSMLVVWVGAYAIRDGNIQVGDLLALMQYVIQTIISFLMISIIFITVPRAAVSLKRVGAILSVKPSIVDPLESKKFSKNISGRVQFNDVEFQYEGSDAAVLEKINFTAEPGQTTAIIGGTGSGKSSILKLIPRLYDVTSGSITIDGIDIRDITQEELHKHIGYVPQKASLFSGTVESNVRYGAPKSSIEEINKAIKTAQAEEFVNELAGKINSPIAQAGNNISGGQKQRLSIARAIAKDPEVYLFDDSFSALDFKTDAALRKALNKEVSDKTFIVVAQRISTIMNAEKIIVLDKGKIVGVGKHSELMKKCKVYKEIAQSQLSADELREAK